MDDALRKAKRAFNADRNEANTRTYWRLLLQRGILPQATYADAELMEWEINEKEIEELVRDIYKHYVFHRLPYHRVVWLNFPSEQSKVVTQQAGIVVNSVDVTEDNAEEVIKQQLSWLLQQENPQGVYSRRPRQKRRNAAPSGLTIADFPEMLALWSPRNTASPADVSCQASRILRWWKDGKGHEWEALPRDVYKSLQTNNTGCYICRNRSGIMVSDILEMLQGFSDKNSNLATEVPFRSNQRFLWKDKLGHEFETTATEIYRRLETMGELKCPTCSGKFVGQTLVDHPLSSQFDLEKNFPNTPADYALRSGKKVWWKCSEGHSWAAVVGQRTRKGYGCPTCYKLSVKKLYHKPSFDGTGVKGSSKKSPRRSTRGGSSFDIGPHKPNPRKAKKRG